VTEQLPMGEGAEGDAVRDLQRRLGELGFDLTDDQSGRFGPATAEAVRAFQGQRGLPTDGVCGDMTWSALVEAGYRLGQRFLYHRTPMLRGDDVAELQARLGKLGFDTGRVDGIFGASTARALAEFQRNSGLTADAICGPDSLAALGRLAGREAGSTSVAEAREAAVQRGAPRQLQDRRVVVGSAGGLGALADRLQQLLAGAGAVVAVLHHPDGSAQAREANDFGAEVYLGLRLSAVPASVVAFYATAGFESVGGRRLAELADVRLRTVLDDLGVADPGARGMRLPVLRETRMPAVVCELGPAGEIGARTPAVAAALADAVTRWIEDRLD
jgi:N-acetylmuramoyl-L-alanine amidase